MDKNGQTITKIYQNYQKLPKLPKVTKTTKSYQNLAKFTKNDQEGSDVWTPLLPNVGRAEP